VRTRSAGIIMIGLGFALMLLLGVTVHSPEVGIGIGGAFALLGAAFVFNGMLLGRRHPYRPLPMPRRPLPPDPPSNQRS
jgi:hypothetical protein